MEGFKVELETPIRWLFADNMGATVQLQYVEAKPYVSNTGKVTGNCLYFLGKAGDCVGDFRVFPSAIANFSDLIAKFGKDDNAWKGKIFNVTVHEDKKRLIFSPL
jgi:hypothetical protein